VTVARYVGVGSPNRWDSRQRRYRPPSRTGSIDGWQLTEHALQRALERRVDVDELRAALRTPTIVRPGTATHLESREYGSAGVVLDPRARKIVTVVAVDRPARRAA
jgi:hypothetical protein